MTTPDRGVGVQVWLLWVTTAPMVLMLVAMSWFGYRAFEDRSHNVAQETADMVQVLSAERLAMLAEHRDSSANLRIVRTLSRLPRLRQVTAWDEAGRRFFFYAADDVPAEVPAPASEGHEHRAGAFYVDRELSLGSSKTGWISIVIDASDPVGGAGLWIGLAGWMLAYLATSLWLAAYVSRNLSRPLDEMAMFAKDVASEQDYDRRTVPVGPPEVQILGEALNGLLERVATQNREREQWAEERLRIVEVLHREDQLRALGLLAGGVAHDFNNVLTAINVTASLVGELSEDQPLREDMNEILRACAMGAGFTRKLLRLAGTHDAPPERMNLNEVVRDSLPLLQRLSENQGADVALVLDLQRLLPLVRVNRPDIEQLLVNLVANGRDAMVDGGTLRIHTELARLDENTPMLSGDLPAGDYVLLAVSDTGCGMSPEVRAKVFQPFFTTKGPEKGTGLGLATVHGIVHAYLGAIDIRSQVGEGTTVLVYLPLPHGPPSQLPRSTPMPVRRVSLRVLLVEDDAVLRRTLRRCLDVDGHRTIEVGDGEEALQVLGGEQHGVQLVLSDVNMPRLMGTELVLEMRARGHAQPVILMSGRSRAQLTADRPGSEVAVIRALPFLHKPFSPADLEICIQSALQPPG